MARSPLAPASCIVIIFPPYRIGGWEVGVDSAFVHVRALLQELYDLMAE